ncbi:MAG: ABC transporter permease [Oscillospiraceae bacterium]|nr:ABC transporter permease [Oscillospiraceae bacterium]MCD8357842.1 ABC transporter permease [Oscillospiraceae bacterium]
MGRFILKRLLWMIPVVLGVTILIFSIMFVVPGDPAQIIAGDTATEAELNEIRDELGLNDPYIVQLGRYMYNVFLRFDFGESYSTGKSVTAELMTRLPRTLIVGLSAMVLSIAIGIPLGVIAAVHRNGWGDRVSMIIALLGVSMPQFWLALMMVLLFSVKLSWLPSQGIDSWICYILPSVALCFGGLAGQARQARSSMLEVISADYVTTARSKGLTEFEVIVKHALPNALMPVITLAGSQLAHIFGGAVAIESVFAIPGIGSYLVSAINKRDYPVIEGSVILLAIVFSIVMLIVDLTYGFVDPRIRARFAGGGKRKKAQKQNKTAVERG